MRAAITGLSRDLLQRLNAWLYQRRLEELLHIGDPPKWKVFLAAVTVVITFWLTALVIFVASYGLHLFYESDIHLSVGGNLIAFLALLFGLFVNAEAGLVDWLETFTRRLSPNERVRMSTGYTEVNRLIRKWRTTGAIFRNTVKLSNIFLFLAGLALALL